MKCDLCKHEETGGKLLCKTCAEAITRLLRIKLTPEAIEEPLAASDSHVSTAGAIF